MRNDPKFVRDHDDFMKAMSSCLSRILSGSYDKTDVNIAIVGLAYILESNTCFGSSQIDFLSTLTGLSASFPELAPTFSTIRQNLIASNSLF